MTAIGFALFDTALGPCGIAWGTEGIVGLHLPEANPARLAERLRQRFPAAVEAPAPPEVAAAIEEIVALMAGERRDLLSVRLDMAGVPEFHRKVYEAARAILPGETATYGEVARRIGEPQAAQAVGQALGKNPFPIVVPCHRVLGSGGKTGGFSANGGVETKFRLLNIERARTGAEPTLFDGDAAFGLAAPPRRPAGKR